MFQLGQDTYGGKFKMVELLLMSKEYSPTCVLPWESFSPVVPVTFVVTNISVDCGVAGYD